MQVDDIRRALESLIGKHETKLALESAAEAPVQIGAKILRDQKDVWW